MLTESLVCASDPRPDTMIMAESGTAPNSGKTIPPGEKDYLKSSSGLSYLSKIFYPTFWECNASSQYSTSSLRMVPIKYKGICASLGPCGKSRSLQGLLESKKKKMG